MSTTAELATASPRRALPGTTRAEPTRLRTDIQALRAVAVLLVLGYHLWPGTLTGGFVGVDVFFVISGYLITSHLLAHPPGHAGEVADFWARRIRRLLPASMLVLVVTLVASRLVAPDTQWLNTAKQAAFAAIYGVNWVLAADSVDYLAAENAASPVQHFWSLSVEEQFYLVWPVLIALLVAAGVRRLAHRRVLVGLGLVVTVSLVVSLVATATEPARAYFITPTRAWEFALGGLLAAAFLMTGKPGRRDRQHLAAAPAVRAGLALLGLVMIGVAAVTFDGTAFPGYRALLPTLGTVAVIAAMPERDTGPLGQVLALRPVQWVGDVSYAIYLWHWPLIVLLPAATGRPLGLLDAAAVIAVTFALAALTKRFVEDPARRLRAPRARVFAATAAAIGLVVLLAGLQALEVGARDRAARDQLSQAIASGDVCLGAGSLIDPERCRGVSYDQIVPAPAQAPSDKSAAYADVGGRDCWSYTPDFPIVRCEFGDATAGRRVALVGNSHAGQWLPALQQIAETDGWHVTTYLASRCALNPADQQFDTAAHSAACRDWVDGVGKALESGDYDLVVLANRMSVSASGTTSAEQSRAAYERGYEDMLRTWSDDGLRVLGLRDTPAPGDGGLHSMPDCVAAHLDDLEACSGPRSTWASPDPLSKAVRSVDSDRIRFADLNDDICGPQVCAGVVGGVLVYYDGSHLTATYARTLVPSLRQAVDAAARA